VEEKDSITAWRADLAWYLGITAASGLAFGIGLGPLAGVLAAATMLAFTLLLAFGRRNSDAVRVIGGSGDERNRDLYTRSLAIAGGVVGLTVTGWYLVTVARGEPDSTLLVLTLLFSATFVGSAIVASRTG
jgi:hypothetical protein